MKPVAASELKISSSVPPRWKHQDKTLSFLDSTNVGFDNSDPGTGKTRCQIEHYNSRPANRKRWLISCPKALMYSAWGTDIERFAPNLSVSYARAENREDAFKLGTDVVIINVDGVKWLNDPETKRVALKYLRDFDHLTIDEYSYYKHATSQRSKAMAAIRNAFAYRYQMSGTPNPNSVMELWHPALILDGGKRLGGSYYKLRQIMQQPTQIGPRPEHLRWDDKPGAIQAVDELLGDVTIRHVFEEVMTHVPPNHRDVKTFRLSPRAQAVYNTMERECLVQVENGVVSAVHAAALRTKLLQIASGAVYDGGENGSYKVVDQQRYELIADLVEERRHSVTFFNWRHQRDLLSKEFEKRGLSFAIMDGNTSDTEQDRIVAGYQRGVYRTLLIHPKTGAHGLTLTKGTTTIVSSPFYEADLLKQAIHRIYRGGQTEVTNTLLVKAAGTVEELVYERLDTKTNNMQDLLNLMSMRTKR